MWRHLCIEKPQVSILSSSSNEYNLNRISLTGKFVSQLKNFLARLLWSALSWDINRLLDLQYNIYKMKKAFFYRLIMWTVWPGLPRWIKQTFGKRVFWFKLPFTNQIQVVRPEFSNRVLEAQDQLTFGVGCGNKWKKKACAKFGYKELFFYKYIKRCDY